MFHKISKILVGIDGSQQSIKAAYKALEISKQNNSEIIAVYISFIPLSLRFKSRDILDAVHKADLEEVTGWLEDIIKEAQRNHLLFKIEAIETTSSIVKAIIDYAETNNIDLILLGNKGSSKIERVVLGSVASGVVNNANCSVMVVR
jgi:nucleotide-binding universal stress UspA family protein